MYIGLLKFNNGPSSLQLQGLLDPNFTLFHGNLKSLASIELYFCSFIRQNIPTASFSSIYLFSSKNYSWRNSIIRIQEKRFDLWSWFSRKFTRFWSEGSVSSYKSVPEIKVLGGVLFLLTLQSKKKQISSSSSFFFLTNIKPLLWHMLHMMNAAGNLIYGICNTIAFYFYFSCLKKIPRASPGSSASKSILLHSSPQIPL